MGWGNSVFKTKICWNQQLHGNTTESEIKQTAKSQEYFITYKHRTRQKYSYYKSNFPYIILYFYILLPVFYCSLYIMPTYCIITILECKFLFTHLPVENEFP